MASVDDDNTAIGIDLGTTYCCVAVYRFGKVEIIANGMGDNTTPSYVCYSETHRLVGSPAKDQAGMCPKNTVFDVKRLIGRRFNDPLVQKDIKVWPFAVRDNDGKPQVEVDINGVKKLYHPEEISAAILTDLKDLAEAYLGKPVTGAVITVPAYFNDSQRHATKDAGRIAGLNVMQLMSEPTAAALAYNLNMKEEKKTEKVVIVDLGGGTFDVSVIHIENHKAMVKGISGDTHLGGEDFDARLVEYCVKEFEKKYKASNLMSNSRAIQRLYKECEKAKRVLSAANSTTICLDSLWDGKDFNAIISRARFEEMNADYFREILQPIEEALRMSEYNKMDIDDIVLVGGSTRIPKIRAIISEYFNGKALNFEVNPDEAVAYGAALQAKGLSNGANKSTTQLKVSEITPLSLGVKIRVDEFAIFLPRGTDLPAQCTKTHETLHDNQTIVSFQIYQGERVLASENQHLGTLKFYDVEPKPKGEIKFQVKLAVDKDGILSAEIVRKDTQEKKELKVELDKGRLSEVEIQQLVEQAEVLRKKDRLEIQRKQALVDLENSLVELSTRLKAASISASVKRSVNEKLNETSEWVAVNAMSSRQTFQQEKAAIQQFFESTLRQETETSASAGTETVENKCVICNVRQRNAMFDCMHVLMCYKCAKEYVKEERKAKRRFPVCPSCGDEIFDVKQLFMY